MSLTYSQARDAILAPLLAAWNPSWPIIWTDVGGTPPASNTPWARAIIRHVGGVQGSLSDTNSKRRWTNSGNLFVQVFAPIGDGSSAAYDAAQTVANGYEAMRNGSVWFRNPKINEAGTNGNFEQVNFIIQFEYDQFS